jgi:hypothetical protein
LVINQYAIITIPSQEFINNFLFRFESILASSDTSKPRRTIFLQLTDSLLQRERIPILGADEEPEGEDYTILYIILIGIVLVCGIIIIVGIVTCLDRGVRGFKPLERQPLMSENDRRFQNQPYAYAAGGQIGGQSPVLGAYFPSVGDGQQPTPQ